MAARDGAESAAACAGSRPVAVIAPAIASRQMEDAARVTRGFFNRVSLITTRPNRKREIRIVNLAHAESGWHERAALDAPAVARLHISIVVMTAAADDAGGAVLFHFD